MADPVDDNTQDLTVWDLAHRILSGQFVSSEGIKEVANFMFAMRRALDNLIHAGVLDCVTDPHCGVCDRCKAYRCVKER